MEKITHQKLYEIWAERYDEHPNVALALEDQVLGERLKDLSGLSVLDLGAGTGRWAVRLAMQGANVTAIEPSDAMREVLSKKADEAGVNIELIKGTAEDLNSEQQYDVIIMSFVFSHISNIDSVFVNLSNHLRPEGKIFITENPPEFSEDKEYDFSILEDQYQVRMYQYTPKEFEQAAKKAGLKLASTADLVVDESVRHMFDAKPHKDYEDFKGSRRGILYLFKKN